MEKSTKKRVRNVVLGMTSVALVAGITASLTLAYLTDTNSKTNVFTGTEGLTGLLLEPDFDGDIDGTREFTDGDTKKLINPDEGVTKPTDNGGWGYEAAQDYMPGDVINKNPYVKNTSKQEAYVKLAVKYYIGSQEVSYDNFAKVATPVYEDGQFNAKWKVKEDSGNTAFYWTSDNTNLVAVASNAQTDPLFTDVKIATDLNITRNPGTGAVTGVTKNGTALSITDKTGNNVDLSAGLPKLEIRMAAVLVGKTDADADPFNAQNALDTVTIEWTSVTA